MGMVRIFFLGVILCSLLTIPASSQTGAFLAINSESSIRKQADSYFERQAYAHAVRLYTRISVNNPEDHQVLLRLADCYRLMREPANAARWYELALKQKSTLEEEHYFNYASVLNASGKFQQAIIWYARYLELKPNEQRAVAAIESLTRPIMLKNTVSTVEMVPINFSGGIFSPALYDQGLVFVGEGATGGLARKVATWSEDAYFDLYYVSMKGGEPGYPKYLDNKLNSVYHEGPVVFFDQGNKVIITRNASHKDQGDTRNLQLMISERKPSGNWSTPKKLFNNQGYSMGHPAINKDGSKMYFASNQPGGYGGTDLYYSEYKNGSWSAPANAGPNINSSGNELFPSIGVDGSLYFASDGHGGLGGLDIFKAPKSNDGKPRNAGYPVNSSRDDFGLVIEPGTQRGYFSSDRTGQERIYRVTASDQSEKSAVPVN